MRFISAEQHMSELSETLEKLTVEQKINLEDITIVTHQDHVDNIKNIVQVDVKTPESFEISEKELLEKLDFDKATLDRYSDLIKNGGYVILHK